MPVVSPVAPVAVPAPPEIPVLTPAQQHLKDLDDAQLARIFGADGFLAKTMKAEKRPFEARPEQLEMAQAISGAIRDKTHLLVEAGTGTGKSYAYLVPFLLWAIENKKRVLIATGTKALQQQLVERDLPFLRELFKRHFGQDIKFALCLGTGNYICPRRLAKAQVAGLFASESEVKQLSEIQQFAAKSPTGRNLDLPFEPQPGLWAQLNRESDLCMNRNCSLYDSSFYWKARREQEKAQILVANHHLLFAHIAAGGNQGGVLPQFDALVIDEAHGAEDVAASYLGVEFSNLGAAKLIELLASRRSNRTVLSASKIPHRSELEARLHDAANEAREAVSRFFENLQLAIRFEPNRGMNVRITRRNLLSNELYAPLERIESVLKDARREAEGAQDEILLKEIDGFINRCAEMRKASRDILEQTRAGHVYWAASVPRPADGPGKAPRVPRLSLHGAPIEVAAAMRKSLFDQFAPVVLTSATMTTGGSFEFLIERLGLGAMPPEPLVEAENAIPTARNGISPAKEGILGAKNGISVARNGISLPREGVSPAGNDISPSGAVVSGAGAVDKPAEAGVLAADVRTLTLGSPFNYRKNALVYVAQDLPDPTTNVTFWEEAAVKRAAEVVKRTEGRAFILCTSFRMVDQTARFLEKVMPARIRILKQGAMARGRLLSEFRDDVSSVLVGTTSFWQGVDVPGESLSCVVIMKLPFAVPDDPIVQARVETIKKRGKDAFNEYQVPQAVMMFRQGFGRLIRTQEDRGVVAILDPRVRSKPYGKTFLNSLPDAEVTNELEKLSLFLSGI